MKHKHAELIKAWADGAEIEYLDSPRENWLGIETPSWRESTSYRIKPEPKPDVVKYLGTNKHGEDCGWLCDDYHIVDHWYSQLKLTFDGETGKLKKAEVL